MTLATILRFQVGRADSIRALALNRASIGIGAVLVVTAAIARHYDQLFILERPLWPVGSMIVSLLASFVIYGCTYPMLWRKKDGVRPGFWQQYPIFLAMFWMTAPVAWLYTFPAERLFDTNTAAIVNISLLGIVSAWRVFLLVRVLSVLTGCRWSGILPRVLLPASALMWAASILTSLSIAGIMGGMLQSPEEGLLLQVGVFMFWGSIVCFVISGLASAFTPVINASDLVPRQRTARFPGVPLAGLVVLFVILAVWPQMELARNHRLQIMMSDGDYRKALDFLGSLNRSDLSPTRPVYPSPYEWEVFAHLPGVFDALSEQDPGWIRSLYFNHLTIRMGHSPRVGRGEVTEFVTLFESLERLPGGRSWVDVNQDAVRQKVKHLFGYVMDDSDRHRLVESLGNLGIEIHESP